jgi:hypothetical protein
LQKPEALLRSSERQQVGPAFQPCSIELADGRVVTGMSLDSNERNRTERFLTADGSVVTVPLTPLVTVIFPLFPVASEMGSVSTGIGRPATVPKELLTVKVPLLTRFGLESAMPGLVMVGMKI